MKMAYSATKTLVNVIQHHLTQPTLRGFDDDGRERWSAIVAKLNELVTPVAAEIEAIFTDPKLTDEGKQTKLMLVGPRVAPNFVNIGIVLNQADQARARLRTLLFAPITSKPSSNETVTLLREQEIRRTLGKRDAHAQFLAALDRDDLETARALLDAPGPAWISDEIRRRGEEAYALRTNKATWEKLQYVEVLRESLSALSQQVAGWLLLLGASRESVQQATKADLKPTAMPPMSVPDFLAKAQAK